MDGCTHLGMGFEGKSFLIHEISIICNFNPFVMNISFHKLEKRNEQERKAMENCLNIVRYCQPRS